MCSFHQATVRRVGRRTQKSVVPVVTRPAYQGSSIALSVERATRSPRRYEQHRPFAIASRIIIYDTKGCACTHPEGIHRCLAFDRVWNLLDSGKPKTRRRSKRLFLTPSHPMPALRLGVGCMQGLSVAKINEKCEKNK